MLPQAPGPPELRTALDSVFATPAYQWGEEPAARRLLREWWQQLGDWLIALRADNPTGFRLLVLALLLMLLIIFSHAAYVVWRTAREAGQAHEGEHRAPREPRDAAWYARAADRAASEGRFSEALQLAFLSLALTLQGQGVLDYHTSKTPAECVRDARLTGPDRERLGSLVRALYAHAFGGRPLASEDYRRWRDAGAPPWHAAAG